MYIYIYIPIYIYIYSLIGAYWALQGGSQNEGALWERQQGSQGSIVLRSRFGRSKNIIPHCGAPPCIPSTLRIAVLWGPA